MKKCPNCHGTTIKKQTVTKNSETSSRVTTIIGKKTPVTWNKTKI